MTMRQRICLSLLLGLLCSALAAHAEDKPVVVWYVLDFAPINIIQGPNKGQGNRDAALRELAELVRPELEARGLRVFEVSATSHEGLRPLTFALASLVEERAGHEVRDALARVRLGVDDVVRADPGEDARVLGRGRLGPDLRGAQVDEVPGDEHARLERGAHPDDGDREVLRRDLDEGLGVRGVGLDQREPSGVLLDQEG